MHQLRLHHFSCRRPFCSLRNQNETNVEKVNVFLNPTVFIEPARQQCAAMVLDMIELACVKYHVADRGDRTTVQHVGSRTRVSTFHMANNTFQTVTIIGFPESRIILSQCAIYLATSAKSNASYTAINKAQEIVKKTGELTIPIALRNAPTKLMKELGYGNEYKYSHDYKNNFSSQKFMPDEIDGTKFYEPGNNLRENSQREYLKKRWKEKYNY